MKNSSKFLRPRVIAIIIVFVTVVFASRFVHVLLPREQTAYSPAQPAEFQQLKPETKRESKPTPETKSESKLASPGRRRPGAPAPASMTRVTLSGTQSRFEAEQKDSNRQAKSSEAESEREQEPRPDQPDEAQRWRMLQLVDENGTIPHNALINAWNQTKQIPFDPAVWPIENPNQDQHLNNNDDMDPNVAGIQPSGWTWLGPGNIGGRIRSIVIHPTNSQVMYVGSVTGGIWKTTNGGTSWSALNDFMGNLGVTTMAMSPSDSNVIYAGTGEGVFQVGTFKDLIRGAGIFKTTDGGTTWTQLSATSSSDWYHVSRLAISPSNSQIILAATDTGVWRSTDGGSTWTKTISTRMLDLNFNPNDGSKCVASGTAGAGARYSTDGGVTWNSATGLPTGGRIELAYARSNPSLVYANVDNNDGEIYLSSDGGQTYALRNTGVRYFNGGAGGQGWYDNIIWVDPTNANILVVGGIDLWRSTNGGTTLTRISRWQSAPQSAHADQHIIVESPQFNGSTNKIVFFGNDGGIYRADDVYSVSQTDGWIELNNNLGITQFYSGAGNPNSGRIVGGTQDNGTLRYTGSTETWNTPFGGDGGWSAADPTDSNYFYGEYVFLNVHRSNNGGFTSEYISGQLANGTFKDIPYRIPDAMSSQTALFIAPFVLDRNNSNRILAGGLSLWRTNDAKTANTNTTGPSWFSIKGSTSSGSLISAIDIAKGNSNIIWVGYTNGDVYFTTDGTSNSPTWTQVDANSPGLPNRYCTRITIDPTNSDRVYVTFGGFSPDNVWQTSNSGSSWTNITANLPSAPVRTLAVRQQNTNSLYVGTEVGVFASANGGGSWSPSNDGPTNGAVDELFWMNDTLVAATYGRGMFSINISDGGCAYSLGPTNQSFASAGGSGSFTVTTSSGCTWAAVSNASWITTSSSGSGNGTVNYNVASNSGGARTGTISVGNQTFTITQSAPSGGCPTTSISPGQTINGTLTTSDCFFTGTTRYVDVYNFSGTAGQQIVISMNSSAFDTYLYLLNSSNQTIADDDDSGDLTNSRIPGSGFFTLPATGTYTIHATSFFSDATGAYSLNLTASSCPFSLSPTSQIFIASASSGSFTVSTSAGCPWTAVSNASWITTNSSGTGNGTVNYSVAANLGDPRTGTINVAGQTFTVFQSGGNGSGCPTTTITVGQTINTTLTTGCVFTGTSRYVDPYTFSGTAGQQIVIAMNSAVFDTFLFLDSPTGQTIAQDDDGGGGTNSRIPANFGVFTLPTTGTYSLFATSYSANGTTGSTGTYSISLFSGCTFSINPTSQNVAATSSSNSFNISAQSSCPWTAVSDASWITTSSSGSGNGTINYSVVANTGAARTGTISVGGQLFTVSQAAGSFVQFSLSSFAANENAGSVTITVTRSGNTAGVASVNFATSDIAGLQSCTVINGRASERCDYVTSVGTVSFLAGQTSKTFTIPTIDDVLVEGSETFTVSLNSASGASLGSPANATVTITDNDFVIPTSNPVDGVDFFIRQQYLDILNRQPDSIGLQNWINTLGPCPNGGFGEPLTSNCDRLHVAAGFFQSDEFLNRGYWVFRFYMLSHNQRPSYAQFIPDMAQVGGPKSPAEEEASKVAFAEAFVQRPEFLARYGGLSGQPLANALLQTAGLPGNTFTVSGNMTNGQIVRGIVETPAVLNKFLTEGTVSIQYFGFLRRDPDTIGYQNNVNTLNANPNNLRHMIFIFIYSTEYRGRFGPQ